MAGRALNSSTIKHVAEHAGFSIATVSRAMNAPHMVSPATLAKIHAAIEALSFQPNYLAQQLRAGRTQLLGVLLPTLANPVFAECVQGIEEAAAQAGYRLLLMTSRYDPESEAHAAQTLTNQRVDGLILTVADAAQSPLLDRLEADGIPYVLTYNQSVKRPSVSVDNRAAAADAVRLLTAKGHRRILMLTGTLSASDRARQRYLGYCDALRQAGLKPLPAHEIDFNAQGLPARTLAELCRGAQRPSAIFCGNDLLAMVAMRSLREAAMVVPAQMSIVGFDGLPVGELLAPSLATVCQPNHEIGARAWRELASRMGGAPASRAKQRPGVILPHRIRPGDSIGAPSS